MRSSGAAGSQSKAAAGAQRGSRPWGQCAGRHKRCCHRPQQQLWRQHWAHHTLPWSFTRVVLPAARQSTASGTVGTPAFGCTPSPPAPARALTWALASARHLAAWALATFLLSLNRQRHQERLGPGQNDCLMREAGLQGGLHKTAGQVCRRQPHLAARNSAQVVAAKAFRPDQW